MTKRIILGLFAFGLFGLLVGLFVYMSREVDVINNSPWNEVYACKEFDVHQLPGTPTSYAIVKDGKRPLIDCPENITPELLPSINLVLLTHSHRDTVAGAGAFVAKGVPVRASKDSAKWLTTANVAKFWKESIP